jgi:hypothetical protein
MEFCVGAGDEARTRDVHLGKEVASRLKRNTAAVTLNNMNQPNKPSLDGCPATGPVTQVEEELSRLSGAQYELTEVVSFLEERLSSVLRQPEKQADICRPSPVLVPLAENIRAHGDSVRVSVQRLRLMIEAIELPRYP